MPRAPITKIEFEKRIKTRFPKEEFEIVDYTSLGKPLSIKCINCGKIISVSRASNFLAPNKVYGCVNCNGLWKQREKELDQLKEKYNILNTFVKETHTYYHIKCKNCGHERTSTLKNLCRHLECGCITNVYRARTAEEFLNEVNRNTKDKSEYKLESEYINQTTKVLLRHIPCGFIWNVRPGDVLHGRSFCPKCGLTKSMGERIISQLLEENNIPYEPQRRLDSSLQRFDFYIETNNFKIAIEYNGKQHYEDVKFFTTPFEVQQERDNRKRQYCKDNGIELIEIPYSDSLNTIKRKIKDIANRLND